MGKTINPEQELRKDYENTVYEYSSDYQPRPAYVDGQYIDVKYTQYDESYTTLNQENLSKRNFSRHPNKKRHKVTNKRFIQTKHGRTDYLNKRFEDYEKQ